MAEMINLRRARKSKAREAKAADAEAARQKHSIPKPVRALATAQKNKDARDIDSRKLDER